MMAELLIPDKDDGNPLPVQLPAPVTLSFYCNIIYSLMRATNSALNLHFENLFAERFELSCA